MTHLPAIFYGLMTGLAAGGFTAGMLAFGLYLPLPSWYQWTCLGIGGLVGLIAGVAMYAEQKPRPQRIATWSVD